MSAIRDRVVSEIDRLAPLLLDVSHRIHAAPELAFEERQAVSILASACQRERLPVETHVFGLETALRADFGTTGPRIAVLSEYDALPGMGHACGHNMIAAIGFGVAAALHSLGADVPGRVRYLGTPAEERGCGKELLLRAGAFDDVDMAMMLHPAGIDAKAIRCLCLTELQVRYRGRSAHASVNPQAGINALDALVLSYQSVAQLRQHLSATQKVHGIFTRAGTAPNIVPDDTAAHYFVRAGSVAELASLKRRMQSCMQAAADATGCTVELEWSERDYLDMHINEPLADAYETNMVFSGRQFIPYTMLPLGTTDMANVSQRVPALHPLIACSPPDVVIHDPGFAAWARSEHGDRAIIEGAKGLALTALDFMTDAGLRQRIGEAFQRGAAPMPLSNLAPALVSTGCECH